MLKFQVLQNNVEKIYKNREKDSIEKILICKLILLETEASEFMNEIEDHKYYKLNKKQNRTKQLEEFCDCIHAVYSIANMLELELEDSRNAYKAKDVLVEYRKLKLTICRFNVNRALNNKTYAIHYLNSILTMLYSIAEAKEFSNDEIVIAFIYVYTKNMIRAKGDY